LSGLFLESRKEGDGLQKDQKKNDGANLPVHSPAIR